MRDPDPSNITGSKAVRWNFTVNVSHLALAVAVLGVAWMLYRVLSSDDEPDDVDDSSEMVDVELLPSRTGEIGGQNIEGVNDWIER